MMMMMMKKQKYSFKKLFQISTAYGCQVKIRIDKIDLKSMNI